MSAFRLELRRLREMQQERGYRPIWVYYKLRAEFKLGLHELELIAQTLDYRRAWAWHQWKALQQENTSNHLTAHLSLLGLQVPYTKEQLTIAYGRMARLTHPDTGGDHETFIATNRAYESLKEHLAVVGGGDVS